MGVSRLLLAPLLLLLLAAGLTSVAGSPAGAVAHAQSGRLRRVTRSATASLVPPAAAGSGTYWRGRCGEPQYVMPSLTIGRHSLTPVELT